MAYKFPGQISEAIEHFRVVPRGGSAEDPDLQQHTGVLRFRDTAIELEVSPGFTPVVSWTETRADTYAGSPPLGRITDDAVVLGVIATNPGEVSLWGLATVAQRSFGFPIPGRQNSAAKLWRQTGVSSVRTSRVTRPSSAQSLSI